MDSLAKLPQGFGAAFCTLGIMHQVSGLLPNAYTDVSPKSTHNQPCFGLIFIFNGFDVIAKPGKSFLPVLYFHRK